MQQSRVWPTAEPQRTQRANTLLGMGRATQEDHELALALALSESEALRCQGSSVGAATTAHDAEYARSLQQAEVEAAQQDASSSGASSALSVSTPTTSGW